jgi:hypothetical protein
MLHDDNEYVEPEKFSPDRFLDKDGQLNPSVLDPTRMAFGFGRRCASPLYASPRCLPLYSNVVPPHLPTSEVSELLLT